MHFIKISVVKKSGISQDLNIEEMQENYGRKII
jgi:hypothetical protein